MALVLANPMQLALARQQRLGAARSDQASYVLFVNKTNRTVNIYWIDYKGQQTLYLTLWPQRANKVNTFRTHPWIFRDQRTGERMHVAHKDIFWPESYTAPDPCDPSHLVPCRKQIDIHLPLRTLREKCLWRIVAVLQNESHSVALNIIEKMHIPHTLRRDLTLLMRAAEDHIRGNTQLLQL